MVPGTIRDQITLYDESITEGSRGRIGDPASG